MTERRPPLPQGATTGSKASLQTALHDLYKGFIHTTQNSLVMIGTLLAIGLIVLAARPELRHSAEQRLLGWLQERHETVASSNTVAIDMPPELTAIDRVTAAEPHALPKAQANVAFWLSRKYRVAPEPLSALVAEAFEIGQRIRIDPTLILAVMAVESRFNPFAQSPVGAQGLMQVMTRVHTDKYEDFGGQLAAFDPMSNLRVGVRVLQDCIKRAGSIEGGLRLYVGAVTTDGSWYIDKVMAEHARIRSVALGKNPSTAPAPTRVVQTVQTGQTTPPQAAPATRVELEVDATAPVTAPLALSQS